MPESSHMRVRLVSQEEVVKSCDRLATQILASGFKPEVIVAVARGGFVPARFLCDFLHIGTLCAVRVQHYAAGAQREDAARITIPLSADIRGACVLLVDDVNDSGDTLNVARPHLEAFSPAALRTAVLHEKSATGHAADFRAVEIREWRWLLYPWAVVEDVGQFIRDMRPIPESPERIRQQLEERHGLALSAAQLERVLRYNAIAVDAEAPRRKGGGLP